MITSTSINAAFIAKLVHAANVAIACESYCEVVTSKGKPSVLVEYDKQSNSLLFTHASGQDCTSMLWQAIEHLVCMPSVELVSAESLVGQDCEPSSYGLIQGAWVHATLLFVMLGILVALGVLSWGVAVAVGGFAVMSYRLMPLLDRASYNGSKEWLKLDRLSL